jgi:predicted alpha/beta hydrolase
MGGPAWLALYWGVCAVSLLSINSALDKKYTERSQRLRPTAILFLLLICPLQAPVLIAVLAAIHFKKWYHRAQGSALLGSNELLAKIKPSEFIGLLSKRRQLLTHANQHLIGSHLAIKPINPEMLILDIVMRTQSRHIDDGWMSPDTWLRNLTSQVFAVVPDYRELSSDFAEEQISLCERFLSVRIGPAFEILRQRSRHPADVFSHKLSDFHEDAALDNMSKSHSPIKELILEAQDGFPLAATLYGVPIETGKIAVIAPALGMPRKSYLGFAQHLSKFGISVLTFDYRGFGDAGPAWRDDAKGGFTALGALDLDAALAYANDQVRHDSELLFVGHSAGTMVLGMAPRNELVSRAVSVASGSGYYGLAPFPRNCLQYLFWSTAVPFATRVHGFFPGRWVRLLGHIPASIAFELSELCVDPNHVSVAKHATTFANVHAKMWALSFTDDIIISEKSVDHLHKRFSSAKITRSHIGPSEVGVTTLGHFGAFQSSSTSLWDRIGTWLAAPPE